MSVCHKRASKRRKHTMTASHFPSTFDALRSYFNRRRSPQDRRGFRSIPHVPQAIMILAIAGSVLFLWTQPAAAAPTITEFHVSNVGVPQGIAAGSDGNLWFTEFYDNVAGRITTKGTSTLFTLNSIEKC